jgi:hypothetical protein
MVGSPSIPQLVGKREKKRGGKIEVSAVFSNVSVRM